MADEDEADLLMQALRSLSDEERERVLGWMFRHLPFVADPYRSSLFELAPTELELRRRRTPVGGQQVVPIRFSSEEHARLRVWSEEHGFSMAAVVRGLVSRFLDGQPNADPKTQQGGSTEAEPP